VTRLTACLIVRQEEATLARCLASLRGTADEIVVVDTGSTDGTVALARGAGARVVEIAWPDDFAKARNVSLAAATGDWILVVDADVELDAASAARLPALLDGATADGFQILVRNLAPPGEIAAWEDMPIVRLFRRREAHRYEGAIHEQVSASIRRAGGRIETADLILVHHGYAQALAQGQDRARRNLAALERAVAASPDDAYVHYQLGATQKAIGAGDAGRAALERAVELDEGQLSPAARAALYLKLGQLALARHDDQAASIYAQGSLELAPGSALALHVLAVALIGLGDRETGREVLMALRGRPELNPAVAGEIDRMIRAL
jgi:tetratricopeptide (TPR) repeat protein